MLKERNGLVRGSAVYLASNVLNAAIPFALLPVLTRFLNTVEYGQVAMFQILVAALAAVTGVSVHGAANRKYYDTDVTNRQMSEFNGACFQILLVTTLMVLLVIFIWQRQLASWTGLNPQWALLAVLVAAAGFSAMIRMGQWQVRKQARNYGAFQVSNSLVNVLLSLALVVTLGMGAAGRIFAQTWGAVAFAILAVALLRKDGLLTWAWRPQYIREALRFGVPLIPHVAGIFLLTAVDRVVIKIELGLDNVGIYVVAAQLSLVMAIVFDAINKAYVPWLYEQLHRGRDVDKKIVRWTYLYFAGVLIAAGAAFLIGPYVVALVAGIQYRESGRLIGWLCLGQAFGGMYLMVTNYIFYSKRNGLLSLVTISTGVLNVLLLVILTKRYGLIGSAWAFSASMAVRFLLTWIVAQHRHPMPWLGSINAISTDK